MALDDYEADATELLETYGLLLSVLRRTQLMQHYIDFLMKYIIIG